jgi:glyoxylase-like metal-dependent hydrolase (beta-lactamase superfamily II)
LNSGVIEVAEGIRRLTFPLPFGLDHVHCYLVRQSDGGFMLVDTGLGLPGAEARWAPVLAGLDGPLERVVVTHFHPDHVGDSGPVAELASAPVFQGRADYEQCRRTWGDERSPERYARHALANGIPSAEVEDLRRDSDWIASLVHAAPDPEPLEPGAELDGWQVLHLPGHADGHLALLRDGVLLAGDVILDRISPAIGFYPDGRPDPLGDYLGTLERIVELAPVIALAGHHEPIADPAGRARELTRHHRDRLDETRAALSDKPRSGYEVSLSLFGQDLTSTLRRFALAESLAHLERLVREERAERVEEDGRVVYLGR